MGSKHLSERDNWQAGARVTGDLGENKTVEALAKHLGPEYKIQLKPPKIVIYSDGKGIQLDAEIYNTQTGKRLLIESKRGDNGGNATEERAYKFATKGLKRAVHAQITNLCDEPFFLVFSGKIFNGENGDREPYIHEYINKKGETKRTKIVPVTYREKVETALWGENYAIADHEFSNAAEIARQIMEIV
jgi:hypothetical protein